MNKEEFVDREFFMRILRMEPLKEVIQGAHEYAEQLDDPIIEFAFEKIDDKTLQLLAFTHSGKTLENTATLIDLESLVSH